MRTEPLIVPRLMGPFNDKDGTYGRTPSGERIPWPTDWPRRWPFRLFRRKKKAQDLGAVELERIIKRKNKEAH